MTQGTTEDHAGGVSADRQAAERRRGRLGRRRMSEEQRKALWHKAVMAKARKLKICSDFLIFACLAALGAGMFLPLVGGFGLKGVPGQIGRRTGVEIAVGLATPAEDDSAGAILGTHPYIAKDEAGRVVELVDGEPANIVALLFLMIPAGGALLALLYVLDYFVFMGRLLPGLSALYGFGCVGYLMGTKVPTRGVWNVLGMQAETGWYMVLIPLFMLGTVSLLRLIVSQRWKRYEFAGLPVPDHLVVSPRETTRQDQDATASGGRAGRDEVREKVERAREDAPAGENAGEAADREEQS